MKRLSKIVCALAMVAGSASHAGQSGDPDGGNGRTALKSNKEEGYPLTSAIWPKRQIPVCWEMGAAEFNHYAAPRELVRLSIASTWEAASWVRFVGWQQCGSTPNGGISIAVQDVGPHVKALGVRLLNRSQGMVLNFEYQNWGTSCQFQKDYCNKTAAVHEFGHALGFAHEQNRPDTPDPKCAAREQGTDGDQLFGSWDLASVMNYCNPRYNGDGSLSPTDIVMVQTFYGPLAQSSEEMKNNSHMIPSIYLLTGQSVKLIGM